MATKITYATLGGDSLEDLHRELDAAIAAAPQIFGREHLLYIDGKHHGTTPPITTFDLEPGMHRIEVRSGSQKPYLTYIMVQAGDVRRIRHDFNVSGAVHPPARPSSQSSNRPVR